MAGGDRNRSHRRYRLCAHLSRSLPALVAGVLACCAAGSISASILFATLLLRSLPEIMQNIKPGQDIWSTKAKGLMGGGLTTHKLVMRESVCFAIGLLLLTVVLALKILTKT